MEDVWASMRGAGTVQGDRLSSSVVEIEPDECGAGGAAAAASISAVAGAGANGGGASAPGGGVHGDGAAGGEGGAPAPSAPLRHRAVVNGVLPIASDDATYDAFKQRGMLYASAINSTGSLWALIPVHRMFPQAAVQLYLHGEHELALHMVASYKRCYDDVAGCVMSPSRKTARICVQMATVLHPVGVLRRRCCACILMSLITQHLQVGRKTLSQATPKAPKLTNTHAHTHTRTRYSVRSPL